MEIQETWTEVSVIQNKQCQWRQQHLRLDVNKQQTEIFEEIPSADKTV